MMSEDATATAVVGIFLLLTLGVLLVGLAIWLLSDSTIPTGPEIADALKRIHDDAAKAVAEEQRKASLVDYNEKHK